MKEIIIEVLKGEKLEISFLNSCLDLNQIVEMKSYATLLKIKEILEEDASDDFKCVEKIICVLEDIGSNAGNRLIFNFLKI